MQAEVSFPDPTRIRARSKGLTVEVGLPQDRGEAAAGLRLMGAQR